MRKRGLGPDDVEDVLQEILLTLHRVRHTYEPGRPVKPWLAAIASRRAIDAVRRYARIRAQEGQNDKAIETFPDPMANRGEQDDSRKELDQLSEGLSPLQKEAIELVKLREMSLAEASATSGQSIASLKVNIHRAIKKMRLNLGRRPRE